MLLEIEDDFCRVSVKSNGATRTKLVALSDVVERLEKHKISSYGLLPKGIRSLERKGDNLIVAIEFPAVKHSFSCGGINFENIPLPAGVMIFLLEKRSEGGWRVKGTYLFALRRERLVFSHDQLCHYPMPNVYSFGKICWGDFEHDLAVRVYRSLTPLEGDVKTFFRGNVNSDLWSSEYLSRGFKELEEVKEFKAIREEVHGDYEDFSDPRSLFRFLETRDDFKGEWLEPMEYNLSEVVDQLLTGGLR